jgi:hypothetical protein
VIEDLLLDTANKGPRVESAGARVHTQGVHYSYSGPQPLTSSSTTGGGGRTNTEHRECPPADSRDVLPVIFDEIQNQNHIPTAPPPKQAWRRSSSSSSSSSSTEWPSDRVVDSAQTVFTRMPASSLKKWNVEQEAVLFSIVESHGRSCTNLTQGLKGTSLFGIKTAVQCDVRACVRACVQCVRACVRA